MKKFKLITLILSLAAVFSSSVLANPKDVFNNEAEEQNLSNSQNNENNNLPALIIPNINQNNNNANDDFQNNNNANDDFQNNNNANDNFQNNNNANDDFQNNQQNELSNNSSSSYDDSSNDYLNIFNSFNDLYNNYDLNDDNNLNNFDNNNNLNNFDNNNNLNNFDNNNNLNNFDNNNNLNANVNNILNANLAINNPDDIQNENLINFTNSLNTHIIVNNDQGNTKLCSCLNFFPAQEFIVGQNGPYNFLPYSFENMINISPSMFENNDQNPTYKVIKYIRLLENHDYRNDKLIYDISFPSHYILNPNNNPNLQVDDQNISMLTILTLGVDDFVDGDHNVYYRMAQYIKHLIYNLQANNQNQNQAPAL